MHTLYVGGLHEDTDTETLRTLFAKFGGITEARVVTDGPAGPCRGFGYVTFQSEAAARQAIVELNGRVIDGHRLRVDNAS